MAEQTKKPEDTQPTEDMFGRPTGRRHEEIGTRPREEDETDTMDALYARGPRPHGEEECDSIDDIPDGDGLRSDMGTNPLPEGYWASYPGQKPDDER